jgi:hypothetical protein
MPAATKRITENGDLPGEKDKHIHKHPTLSQCIISQKSYYDSIFVLLPAGEVVQ